MTRERTDVVYGADPFKGEQYSRPWLIVNNRRHPFSDEQYIVVPLTTKSWHDGFVPIPADAWVNGGTPEPSNLVPWSVHTLDEQDVEFWQGTLDTEIVDRAVSILTAMLESTTDR